MISWGGAADLAHHLSTKHSRSRRRLSQGSVTTLSTILAKGAVRLGACSPVFSRLGPSRAAVIATPAPQALLVKGKDW